MQISVTMILDDGNDVQEYFEDVETAYEWMIDHRDNQDKEEDGN